MIFSEYVMSLTESFEDEKNLILDDTALIQLVKTKFLTADCKCHALDASKDAEGHEDHISAISFLLPEELRAFHNQQKLYTQHGYTDKFIQAFTKYGVIDHADEAHRKKLVKYLFPYSIDKQKTVTYMKHKKLSEKNCQEIVCLYNDLQHPKLKIVIDNVNNTIVTVYKPQSDTYWQSRYSDINFWNPKFFNILFLAKYDAKYIETYKILRELEKQKKLLSASFEKIVYRFCEHYWNIKISPQTKQTVIRKLDDELRQYIDNTALQQIEKM